MTAGGERLDRLRARMRDQGLDHYLVPSSDAHQNEYVPARWQRRAWLSGFTGSAGELVVGLEGAWLLTDSRYWLQAETQLAGTGISLVRLGSSEAPGLGEWLAGLAGSTLGVDPRLISAQRAKELDRSLTRAGGRLARVEPNLVDEIREAPPTGPGRPAEIWPLCFSGASVVEKLSRVRAELAAVGASQLVVTKLDAIAWLLNLRGSDVAYNPLLIGYALVDQARATLFTSRDQLGEDLLGELSSAGVHVEPYDRFEAELGALTGRVLLDPNAASARVADLLSAGSATPVEGPDPIAALKARKNQTERDGMRSSHERDGLALVRFLHWLHTESRAGELDELGAAEQLDAFRREGAGFRDLSFPTISGFGPNGAVVHYRVTQESALPIDESAPYLVDSGAHYDDGTTDVTRTVHLGTPTLEQRDHYTRVLRGHLAIRRAVFPRGTTGAMLDPLARQALWEIGLDYGHNTGHGVGCYLNVHEGPPGIGPRYGVPLEPGMVVSNEPGVYLAGRHGIRIENLLLVEERLELANAPGFLGFDDLTLVPYARELIDVAGLSPVERAAVDAYHARVRNTLLPRLPGDSADWLSRATAPLA